MGKVRYHQVKLSYLKNMHMCSEGELNRETTFCNIICTVLFRPLSTCLVKLSADLGSGERRVQLLSYCFCCL